MNEYKKAADDVSFMKHPNTNFLQDLRRLQLTGQLSLLLVVVGSESCKFCKQQRKFCQSKGVSPDSISMSSGQNREPSLGKSGYKTSYEDLRGGGIQADNMSVSSQQVGSLELNSSQELPSTATPPTEPQLYEVTPPNHPPGDKRLRDADVEVTLASPQAPKTLAAATAADPEPAFNATVFEDDGRPLMLKRRRCNRTNRPKDEKVPGQD